MSDAAAPSVPSADIAALADLFKKQMEAANEREKRLDAIITGLTQQSQPRSSPAPPAPKPVAAERPMLLSSASLSEFAAWQELWEDFSRCQHLTAQSRETRVSAIRQCLDEDLRRFIREGTIVIATNPDACDVLEAVKQFLRRQRNPILDRIEFYKRTQQKGELFDGFHTSLKELFNTCDFVEHELCSACSARACSTCKTDLARVHADMMRDRIVIGILDDTTRHKLLSTSDLILEATVNVCRAEEAATQTSHHIPTAGQVNAARKSSYQRAKLASQPPVEAKHTSARDKCRNCGRTAHTKSPCPAINKVCLNCNGTGHFRAMCRRPAKKPDKSSKIAHLRLNRASLLDDATVSVATQLVTEPEPVALSWLPDTGSDVDAIGTQHLDQLGGFVENLLDDIDDVRTADGASLTPVGKISATLSCGPNQHTSTIHVYDGLTDALLSRSSLHALGYLPSGWPKQIAAVQQVVPSVVPDAPADKVVSKATDSETMRAELLAEFADVFDDSVLKPMLGGPMEIRVRADAKPVAAYHARQIPHAYRDQVKSQLDDMVQDAIIEEVTEPSAWCHPIVIVDKKGTNEKRLTVDFKKLNDQVERPAHPAPSPRDAVSSVGNARYFTKLDARHGYWQVPLSEASRPLTTFMTPWGRYRYLRNPQGLVSAGDEFNRRTDAAFAHISQFQKVVDDCLVYDNDLNTHRSHVRDVLLCARENGITLSAKKFVFGMPAVEFCGYRISADGWTVDDAKVKAISQFPAPSNRTDLRSFMGLINQCGEFTPHLSEHAAPLRPLLKTSNEFVWDSVHTDAVNAA
ncbi:uncharacterized protein LOC135824328 [Sycon ciliatum]|uniref:uncharacterized protein LOC135824328 n=1 Tax=Sycon ciliatum TaxID=27933 RepID=UPI0031F62DDE